MSKRRKKIADLLIAEKLQEAGDRIEELERQLEDVKSLLESEDSVNTAQINKQAARITELERQLAAFRNGIDTDWMKDNKG